VQVEIWSDIACPWCYIGKRRFEAALSGFEGRDEVTVTWRSFELDPGAPPERTGERAQYLASKYGMSLEQAREMEAQMTERAAADGLEYRLDIARAGNTFDAHRMLHLAAAHGVQDAFKERAMRAYFTEGELMSDHDTLARLAADVGIPEDEAREALASDRFAAEVREDQETAYGFGIQGVPFFVFDRALGVSGAQPAEVLAEALRQAAAAIQPR
jgi:predicted DsbA family dithiol-disulfide isomerase